MKLKELAVGQYLVLGVMDGDTCPAEEFLHRGEESTRASREGLLIFLKEVAKNGLHNVPSAWMHEVDKRNKIFEFKKGDLRLFFFKGENGQIAVCTSAIVKKSQKVDRASVAYAANLKGEYMIKIKSGEIEVIKQ